jgi:hypothetical protein
MEPQIAQIPPISQMVVVADFDALNRETSALLHLWM